MTCRPFRALRDDERGFSLVEVMVGMGIFAVIAIGFAGTMAASLRTQLVSRQRTVASELAAQQVETVRRMAYTDVGTVGGNPPGTLQAIDPDVVVDGDTFEVRTTVELVDDPVPGAFRTFANYKRLTVAVHDDETGKRLARARTVIAPPTQPSLIHAVVQAKVTEVDEVQGVAGVQVRLSGGPSPTRTGVTDDEGFATFAALTPTNESGTGITYRVDVVDLPLGWHVLPEDLVVENVETPALATQRVTVRLRAYRKSALDISLLAGEVLAGAGSVQVSSPFGSEDFPVPAGQLTVTSVAGRPVMTGVDYTITATSGPLTGSALVKAAADEPTVAVDVLLGSAP